MPWNVYNTDAQNLLLRKFDGCLTVRRQWYVERKTN